ncbi:MAG: tyrosine-protein phosphatase [Candidatus Competibacteraceae bacterium]
MTLVRRYFMGCLFPFVVALAIGCATRPTTPTTRTLASPCETCIPGVSNFAKVSAALWRGAQPTSSGFRHLEAAGVKTIINLRHDHDDLPMLAGTGLKYLWIPMRAWRPQEQDLVILLKVLDEPKNQPVFVHCAEGKDRTGYSVAAYRIVSQYWPPDDAIQEMFDFHYHSIWFNNLYFLRRLNSEQIRLRVKLAP